MGDQHDSWLSGIGVDVGSFYDKAVQTIENKAAAVVQEVKTVVQKVENTASGAVKTISGAASPKPASPSAKPKQAAPPSAPGNGAGGVSISGSVGRGGKNQPEDVKAIQRALGIGDDGKCGQGTITAIENFQRSLNQKKPDGRIDPGGPTLKALLSGGKAAPASAPAPEPAPAPTPPAKDGEDSDDLLGGLKKLGGQIIQEGKDLKGKVVKEIEDDADALKKLGGKVIQKVEDGAGSLGLGDGKKLTSNLGGKLLNKSGDIEIPFDVDVPALPKVKVPAIGGKIEIEVAMKAHVAGKVSIDDSNKTKVDTGAMGVKVGKWWLKEKGEPALEKSGGLWSNFKPFAVDGASLVAKTSAQTAIGTIELKVTFIGVDKKLEKDSLKIEPKVLEAEGKLEHVEFDLGTQEIEGLKFTNLKIGVAGQVTVAPQWKKIIGDILKDQFKGQFEKWAERAAVSIGADVIIAGSLIIGGIATIAGACYQIAFGFKLMDMTQSYKSNLENMEAGFRAGMSQSRPSSNPYAKKGYELGQENFKRLVARTKEQNPQATDEQINAAVAAKADDATREAINSGAVESSLKNGMWDGLLAEGKWLFTAKDAATAFQACGLGNDPRFDTKAASSQQWKKYLTQYPVQSKL